MSNRFALWLWIWIITLCVLSALTTVKSIVLIVHNTGIKKMWSVLGREMLTSRPKLYFINWDSNSHRLTHWSLNRLPDISRCISWIKNHYFFLFVLHRRLQPRVQLTKMPTCAGIYQASFAMLVIYVVILLLCDLLFSCRSKITFLRTIYATFE